MGAGLQVSLPQHASSTPEPAAQKRMELTDRIVKAKPSTPTKSQAPSEDAPQNLEAAASEVSLDLPAMSFNPGNKRRKISSAKPCPLPVFSFGPPKQAKSLPVDVGKVTEESTSTVDETVLDDTKQNEKVERKRVEKVD